MMILKLDIDISYNLGISNYLLDLSGTLLGQLLNIEPADYHNFDLSGQDVIMRRAKYKTVGMQKRVGINYR